MSVPSYNTNDLFYNHRQLTTVDIFQTGKVLAHSIGIVDKVQEMIRIAAPSTELMSQLVKLQTGRYRTIGCLNQILNCKLFRSMAECN